MQLGTNRLAGVTKQAILDAVRRASLREFNATLPPLWDGQASRRIVNVMEQWLGREN
jgi:UDP-N-acetylglucosamine 2-epimerase